MVTEIDYGEITIAEWLRKNGYAQYYVDLHSSHANWYVVEVGDDNGPPPRGGLGYHVVRLDEFGSNPNGYLIAETG